MSRSDWKVGALLAYAGREDCTSVKCRRYLDPPGEPISPGCIGFHCAVCDKPSGQYGHAECREQQDSAEE